MVVQGRLSTMELGLLSLLDGATQFLFMFLAPLISLFCLEIAYSA